MSRHSGRPKRKDTPKKPKSKERSASEDGKSSTSKSEPSPPGPEPEPWSAWDWSAEGSFYWRARKSPSSRYPLLSLANVFRISFLTFCLLTLACRRMGVRNLRALHRPLTYKGFSDASHHTKLSRKSSGRVLESQHRGRVRGE